MMESQGKRSIVRQATYGLMVLVAASLAAWTWSNRTVDWHAAAATQTPVPPQSATNQKSLAPVPLTLSPSARRRSTDQQTVDAVAAKVDATADDWSTEVVSDKALAQLKKLGRLLDKGQDWKAEDFEWLVDDDFACEPLAPDDLTEVYRDSRIAVQRSGRDAATGETKLPGSGSAALVNALKGLVRQLGDAGARHTHFKLFRIEQKGGRFTTRVRYEAEVHAEGQGRQQTATWNCEWTNPDDAPPRLASLRLVSYEQVTVDAPGGKLFVDCTAAAMGDCPEYNAQVMPGVNDWQNRMSSQFVGLFGHNGLAVGDVNGDLLDDLYVCDVSGLPNRLYVQQPDGTVQETSSESGVDFLDDSSAALFVDLDNDGDQDLIVAAAPLLQIAENSGTGKFRLLPPIRVDTEASSISACDFDSDGDLDLFVCGNNVRQRGPGERDLTMPVPYYDATNGGRNLLFRNRGAWNFVEVTKEVGLDENNSRFSMAAAWEDFDDDGDQDLYVANDFGRNNLFRNDGGRFTDIAKTAGVEDHASGMSVSWADYNRDGRMDVYIGNMFSSAGGRVTYQRQFSTGRTKLAVERMQRMARGNTLFANASVPGTPRFRDVSEQQSVEMGRWAWSSQFADLTNDGWPDLVVANGYVSNSNPDDL